jgi:dGTPase
MEGSQMAKCPRERSEEQEPKYLTELATKSTDPVLASRIHPQDKDRFRTEFQRDYTRIIHSRPFRRMRHKTQVFVDPQDDHLCTRLEHSLHVASVARTISKALELNNELVAAIAVGHDLGHAPFGHHGEGCLQQLVKKKDAGLTFEHEIHSLRVVDHLESPYEHHDGLNLTFAVRDGIVCHSGERFEPRLEPNWDKKPDDLATTAKGDLPATLEGCVVRHADKIAYLGRDLEDAVALKVMRRDELPQNVRKVLGDNNRQIIASLVGDIFANSEKKPYIALSDGVADALNEFYSFSIDRLYNVETVRRPFAQIDTAMGPLFQMIFDFIKQSQAEGNAATLRKEDSSRSRREPRCRTVLADFLERDVRDWQKTSPAQLTVDFIAGMTDNYFIRAFEELFLPRSTV